ncbi:uncharacterized protein LOC143043816 [Mytilus galloprovincialis]|uniref:uncharacterized protein LOC143043816 n=1 Tax=Mytilus galloprovincialis TaxID=29158 RepID=UPI003F7CADA8
MADKNMISLITELERRYLECSICTEVFDEDGRKPRLLPCHHSFCSECLERLGRRKDTLICPSCNAVHKVKLSKREKKDLGIDVESLRTQILRVKSILQKVQKTTASLQEEGDKFHRNVYPIYDRNIKRLLDQYDIAFQRIESKLVTRKYYLSRFLKNASECCSLSEQLINCNSISSFLNVHPIVDGQLKLYLNTQVYSTEGEIDLELKTFLDDSLRLLERSVNSQKNHEGDEVNSYQRHQDEILLVNQGIGNHQDIHLENTIHAYGKNIFLPVATSTMTMKTTKNTVTILKQ